MCNLFLLISVLQIRQVETPAVKACGAYKGHAVYDALLMWRKRNVFYPYDIVHTKNWELWHMGLY